MSSILETGNNKAKCQKFTPDTLVETMLDLAGYTTDLMEKTILENSFGTGNILKAIVARYIKSANSAGYSKEAVSFGLSRDIYGIELDKGLFDNCIRELNDIVSQYALPAVDWKLFQGNALEIDLNVKFAFIVGNPPYISYKEMDDESRKALKEKFVSCSAGKFDYCSAFIESAISLLKDTGKLVQLIPNNIYKNVFAQKLREKLKVHLSIVYDYPNQKLFDKTLTSVSLFLYEQDNISDNIQYKNITNKQTRVISRKALGDKWTFDSELPNADGTIRFGDVFNASVSIATLLNEAFLLSERDIQEEQIEPDVVYKAVSPRSLQYQTEKYIIFPYKYDGSGLVRFTANEFEKLFPNATKHLKRFSKELAERDSDKNAAWFEYGRSQALSHINTEKLLVSTITTRKVEIHKIGKDAIPYSGIYITVKNSDYSLDDAISVLRSNQFMEYIRRIGISVNGKSIRITCKDINDFRFVGGQ